MARGYLAGMIWGAGLSVLAAGAASLIVGPQANSTPGASAVEIPPGSEFNQGRDDEQATLPAPQSQPKTGATPQVNLSQPDTLKPLADLNKDSARPPASTSSADSLSEPAAESALMLNPLAEAPVLPSPQAQAPAAPRPEEQPLVSTTPVQPGAGGADATGFPRSEVAEVGVVIAQPEAELPITAPQEAAVPEPLAQPQIAPQEQVTKLAVAERREESVSVSPLVPTQPLVPGSQSGGAGPAQTGGETAPEAGPSIGRPTTPLIAPQAEEDARLAPVDPPAPLTPLQRYASDFENPEEKPLMSIVLIDDAGSPAGPAALEAFPYPLSIAVNAAAPDAQSKMKAYRAHGFEVLALADLPEGAAPRDAETAFTAYLSAVPEAVAILEGESGGLQASSETAAQVRRIAKDSGLGLVLLPKGPDTAQKLATKEGVPAATVFRDFDDLDRDPAVIRRFLDQAAFKASREEKGVIMLGHLRPEMLAALILWGVQDRATRVAMAPVSAVLLGE